MRGLMSFAATAMPPIAAAAADGYDDRIEFWNIGQHFQCDGSLSGDDVRIVVRVHESKSFFVRDFVGIGFGLADGIAFENDACTESLGSADLRKGLAFRHNDGRCESQALRVVGDALCVIPRRNGNDPIILFLRDLLQFHERASVFKGPCPL